MYRKYVIQNNPVFVSFSKNLHLLEVNIPLLSFGNIVPCCFSSRQKGNMAFFFFLDLKLFLSSLVHSNLGILFQ